jgi:hypothetical protein
MKIFDIKGDKVVLNSQTLGVPSFKVLWERDKTKDKKRAENEITYITFLCDTTLDNPYRGYSEYERDRVLKRTIFKREDWVGDSLVEDAITEFKALQKTATSRLYEESLSAVDKLSGYFRKIDFDKTDDDGKPIYSAKELAQNLSAIGNIVRSLKQLEQIVRQEQMEVTTARGGSYIGEFELKGDWLDD